MDGITVGFCYDNMYTVNCISGSSGLAYWVECLNEGVSPEYVVSGFAGSEEFIQICNSYGIQAGILTLSQSRDQNIKVTGFLNRCYRLFLERKGDEDGLNFWSRFLLDHYYGGGEILQQLINSNEFIARGLSDTEFIELMYLTMLDREADAGGKAVWVEYLDFGMSMNYVISCFVYSEEFMNICDEYGILNGDVELNENRDINPQITKFVNRCYRETLGRKWDVDGLNSWTGILLKGEMSPNQVAKSFVFSEEVLNKNLTDDQFVKILYKVYMGREADEAGLNYWIGQIQTGTSWNDMVDQFSNTEEFWEIEEAYGFYREGWHIVDGNLRYYGTDGKPVTNCWKKKEDAWYYLGDAGDVVRNEIIREHSADWYYVDSDGKMVEDQWIALPSGDFRYDYETDFYYADSSGKLARSSWKKIQGVFYYFDQDGICVGNRIVVDKQGQYYLKPLPDASLLTDSNLIYGGIAYKADQDGRLTIIRFSEGWYMSDGEWYYYDAYGNAVVNQWKMIGDDWYYLGPKGKLEKNKVIKDGTGWYYVNSAGIMVSNQWIALDSKTHRYGFETDFYYAKASGKLIRDNMLTIDERTYYFDHDGICVGDLIITHEGNQYYFKPLPDGSMLKNSYVTYQGVTYKADEAGSLQK